MKLARLVLFAASALTLFQIELQARPASRFVVISDIHFNPLADPALVQQLIAAEPSQWEAVFAADPRPATQHYNEDSVWPLLASLVSQVQSIQPRPKLIVVPGDILPHKFQEKFASASHSTDPAAFRNFVKKTIAFVGLELQKASGGAAIIYALGNNDADCGDYALEPGGPFLIDSLETVQSMLGANANTLPNWTKLGSYVTTNPLAKHHRILSLDTSFWSRRYANSCDAAPQTVDPGAEVLNWLADQLRDAQSHRDKVWLVFHIPPGIDGHSSSRTNQTTPFWKPSYADGFNKLLDQYRNTIELNLAGHTHLDDIRLVNTEHGTSLVLINPGISPTIGQNPAYRVITVDLHARPLDQLTYYKPDLESSKWQLEYDAREAWGLKRIDANSYEALYREIGQSPTVADKWKLYYSVSRPASLINTPAYVRSLYCATGHAETEAFQACLVPSRQ